jgi:hypothetical protein
VDDTVADGVGVAELRERRTEILVRPEVARGERLGRGRRAASA